MRESLYDYCIANEKQSLLEQWDKEKNGGLTPHNVTARVRRKVWWICDKGHGWEATIESRTRGAGCPVCAGQVVIPGVNDFASAFPEIAAQWHPTKNGGLCACDVTPHSGRKVWWICEQGHEWSAAVAHRVKGSGCPVCANQVVIAGENDLATSHPHLAAQWDYEKNAPLTPQQLTYGSRKVVWWRCEKGHAWQAQVKDRAKAKGTGCPVCDGKKVVPGENDFASAFPDIAAEWHPTKNGELRACVVARYSGRKVWWRCANGH